MLSSSSKTDFTKFQPKIFSKPTTIVNMALFVLIFLNLPQGDILTRAEKHFKELKDSSSPLPTWYQDRLNKQWKPGKLILQGKGYACISPDGSNELTWLPLQKIRAKGGPSLQDREETAKTPGRRNSNTGHNSSKNLQKTPLSAATTLWSPLLGTNKNTHQAENMVSQQEMPRNPENILVALLAFLACAFPAQAESIKHTYWAYISNPPLLQVVDWMERGPIILTNNSTHMSSPLRFKGPSHTEEEGRLINISLGYEVLPLCMGPAALCRNISRQIGLLSCLQKRIFIHYLDYLQPFLCQ